jgi:hypothetical protein
MEEQLNRAYELIKAERFEEARNLLEPFIRANRDNADVWWLYANATEDPAAKRNALQNILRIGTNEVREDKVYAMLTELQKDDLFALPERKSKRESRPGSNRSRWMVGFLSIFGLFICIACFAIMQLGNRLAYRPTSYENMGVATAGEILSGTVDAQSDWDGYTFEGRGGETITVTVESKSGDFPPYVFLYRPDDTLVWYTNDTGPTVNRMRVDLPTSGTYVLIVRTFIGLGGGDYEMTIATR